MKMELKFRRTHFPRRPSGIYGHSGVWQRKSTKMLPAGLSEAEGEVQRCHPGRKRERTKKMATSSLSKAWGEKEDDAH